MITQLMQRCLLLLLLGAMVQILGMDEDDEKEEFNIEELKAAINIPELLQRIGKVEKSIENIEQARVNIDKIFNESWPQIIELASHLSPLMEEQKQSAIKIKSLEKGLDVVTKEVTTRNRESDPQATTVAEILRDLGNQFEEREKLFTKQVEAQEERIEKLEKSIVPSLNEPTPSTNSSSAFIWRVAIGATIGVVAGLTVTSVMEAVRR